MNESGIRDELLEIIGVRVNGYVINHFLNEKVDGVVRRVENQRIFFHGNGIEGSFLKQISYQMGILRDGEPLPGFRKKYCLSYSYRGGRVQKDEVFEDPNSGSDLDVLFETITGVFSK
jgi:hypothetical protein